MAQSVGYTTVSSLSKAYKRSTTKLYRAYTKRVPEYRWLDNVPDEDIVPSGRENLIPVDVDRGYGAAMLTDAGYESRTETPALQEGSFVFVHCNSRFAISLRAQALDKAARGNYIIRQIKYQSIKCIEAVMRKFAYQFYGFSTGVLCRVNGDPGAAAASHTLTLDNAFGITTLNDAAYIQQMFTVGEGVALIRANALIAIGTVTAVAATPSITVSWNSGSPDPADNDEVVYANAVTDTTLTATDFNQWPLGLLDFVTSASVHGLAAASFPAWAAARNVSTGGSFGFVKAKKMRQALENQGDTTLRRLIVSNGVENDMQAKERGAVIWSSPDSMTLDGNVRLKGVDIVTSRFTPPTYAFGIGADAIGKKVITERPDEEELIDFGRLFKAEDRSALKGGVDMIWAHLVRSRARLAMESALNEQ